MSLGDMNLYWHVNKIYRKKKKQMTSMFEGQPNQNKAEIQSKQGAPFGF